MSNQTNVVSNRSPWFLGVIGIIGLLVVLALLVFLVIVPIIRNADASRPEGCGWLESTENCLDRLNGDLPVRWQDAVQYPLGGSGPADPSGVFESDQTAVDHSNRLIVENPDLAVRECFVSIDDDTWEAVAAWADQWGSDSRTRIEWQINESRCSWVFPGNITDPIGQDDYEELLVILAEAGLTDTWFVAGEEGQEFGRVTYEEIVSVDPTFNRLHVYGPALPAMPVPSK